MNGLSLDQYMAQVRVPNITGFTPTVIEERQMNVVGMDVFSRLTHGSHHFMGVPVNDYVSECHPGPNYYSWVYGPKRYQIFINSPGGSVIDGLGIYDTMQYVTLISVPSVPDWQLRWVLLY